MNSRALYIVMVLWLTAWYGVIVPGHQRGMVLVPGAERRISAGGSCCEQNTATQPTCNENGEVETPRPGDTKKKSNPERVKNCAVCAIAGLIDMPPPLVLSPVPTEPGLTIRPFPRDVSTLELPGHTVPFKRGPPQAAA